MLNMGGPADLDGVQDYIYQLLADPDMVRFPASWLLQKPLAKLISVMRAPKVRKRYALIGGSSPIDRATADQAAALEGITQMPVSYAMRYTPPAVRDAVTALQSRGAERIVAITLYPQYSTVSTLSSIRDYKKAIGNSVPSRFVEQHFDEPKYIEALTELLRETLQNIDPGLKTHLLFTAHSIPEAYVKAGDPYPSQIEGTAALILAGIENPPPHSLAYQSQVGPVEWRGPTLEDELARLKADGVQQLVVHCLSFVSDNLETLWDLDHDFKSKCAEQGITAFHRVPTVNTNPVYIESLAALTRQAIESWERGDA